MNHHHRKPSLYAVLVQAMARVSGKWASAPALALLAFLLAAVAVTHLPVAEPAAEVRLAGDESEPEGTLVPLMNAAVRGETLTSAARAYGLTAPVLSREQQNVAHFIASTYQVASEQTQWFVEHAYRAARELKIDPILILAIISVESRFNPKAQSVQGAEGLMQVLTRVHAEKFSPFGGVAAAFDPLANIRVGAQILSYYLKRDGSVEGALKGYVGASAKPSDGGYGAKVILAHERLAAVAGRPVGDDGEGRALPVAVTPPLDVLRDERNPESSGSDLRQGGQPVAADLVFAPAQEESVRAAGAARPMGH